MTPDPLLPQLSHVERARRALADALHCVEHGQVSSAAAMSRIAAEHSQRAADERDAHRVEASDPYERTP